MSMENGHEGYDHEPGERVRDAGAVVREEFGARQITRSTEKGQSVLAARATAEIQAAFIVARQNPRDLMEVRSRLLKAAQRPGFAETAIYAKPLGKQYNKVTKQLEETFATGPSIRFVEEALRCLGNATADSSVIEDVPSTRDEPGHRTFRVVVLDLEANLGFKSDITVIKTVERSKLREGQHPFAVRTNSYGKPTYVVEATEDDMLMKSNALISKAIRTNGARLVPGDIMEEAQRRCRKTRADETARDPDFARKSLADGFAALGITPSELARYLGHPLESATVDELIELKAVGVAIRDGVATWRDILEARLGDEPDPDGEPKKSPAAAAVDAIKEKLKKGSAKAPEAPTATPTQAATATAATAAMATATTATTPVTGPTKDEPPAATPTTATTATPEAEREPGDDDDRADPDDDEGDPSGKAAEAFERAQAEKEAAERAKPPSTPAAGKGGGLRIGTPKGGTK